MISAGDSDKPDVRPRVGARLSTMRGRLALTGRWRGALGLLLGLMLCGPVVSVLASPGVGRASKAVGRRDTAVAGSRRQRLAELDVSAAAVKLLAGNVLAGTATVGNVGSARARSSTADVAWKSSDSGGLVQLGRFQVPALKPGQHHKARFQFDLPKGASGSYEVSVCADVLGQVQERSKKTDCRDAGVITVSGSGVKASGPTSSEPSSPAGSPPGGSSPAPESPTPTPPASSPPSTVIDSGPSGLIGVSSVMFTFHGSDTNDTFQCSLDGAPWVICTSPQQYTALAEGVHTFQVRAVNAAGEVDPTPASASFTIEATPPQTTITSTPSARIPIGEVSISFTSNEPGSTFQCSLDSAAYSPCSSPDVIKDPAAGPHTFKVQATNQAGIKETAGPPSASWSSVEPQHDLCGTISSNTTIGPDYAARYIITCSTTVTSGATLTAQPGTIIKAEQGTQVSVEGALDAVGTASEPITFTSVNDNSVGGATGSGSPAPGDWEGIGSSGGGSIDLVHAKVSYARTGVSARGEGATVIEDDAFASQEQHAVTVHNESAGAPSPTLEDDSSVNASVSEGLAAFAVRSQSLDADLLGGNSATGSGSEAVALEGTIAATSTLPAEPAAWEVDPDQVGGEPLTVPAGKTLTIAPGAVLKGFKFGEPCGCAISVEGALDAVGTASEPITFTSVNDNSVGGATGSGSPAPGDWEGIGSSGGGSIDLVHAKVSYARTGVSARGEGATVIEDDAFASQEQHAVTVHNESAGAPSPTLEDDSSVNASVSEGLAAFAVRSQSLDADLLGGNSATGSGSEAVALEGTIAATSTLPAEPAAWEVDPDQVGGEPLTVPAGKTLTIAPGAVLKGFKFGEPCGCAISVEGALDAVGTASEPITFTSVNDNSVGGATGSGSPAPGDWEGIGVQESGSAQLEHTTLEYAATALDARSGAEVTIHGAILNSTVGVEAGTFVEATEVDWGSTSGPSPIGTGTPIVGEVLTTPWIGYVPPTQPSPPPPPEEPDQTKCKDILFIGARGSGESPQEGEEYSSEELANMGPKVRDAEESLESQVDGYAFNHGIAEPTIRPVALRYPADSTDELKPGWNPFLDYDDLKDYDNNIWDGVYAVEDTLKAQEARCDDSEKVILAGYSSGALAIHIALHELEGSPLISPSRITAILLIADPARPSNGSESDYGSAAASSDGIYTKIKNSPPIPENLVGRTYTLCDDHDIVCAPDRHASAAVHSAYTYTEIEQLSEAAATDVFFPEP